MTISTLQKARYSYNPKLPGMLRNGNPEIETIKEGTIGTSVEVTGKKEIINTIIRANNAFSLVQSLSHV